MSVCCFPCGFPEAVVLLDLVVRDLDLDVRRCFVALVLKGTILAVRCRVGVLSADVV